jgi:ATP-dependent DNA ligase
LVANALERFSPAPNTFQADGFILLCQPALADRPPSGPGWLHEIKFDGHRVIAGKDGAELCLWARTTSDYSKAFTRVRDAVAALPVESAVLDGEAIVMRAPIPFVVSQFLSEIASFFGRSRTIFRASSSASKRICKAQQFAEAVIMLGHRRIA